MTAKKEVKKYVLFDPYGDVVSWGTMDTIKSALEDAIEYEQDLPEDDDWKVYELGPKVALSFERELEVFIG
jgi:hypothetical protein